MLRTVRSGNRIASQESTNVSHNASKFLCIGLGQCEYQEWREEWYTHGTALPECTGRGMSCLLRLSVNSGKVNTNLASSSLHFVEVGVVSSHLSTQYQRFDDKRTGEWYWANSSLNIPFYTSLVVFTALNEKQIVVHSTCNWKPRSGMESTIRAFHKHGKL